MTDLKKYDRIEIKITEEHINRNSKSEKVSILKPGWTLGRVMMVNVETDHIIIDIPGDEQIDPSFDFQLSTLEYNKPPMLSPWIPEKQQMIDNVAEISKKVGFSQVETNVKIDKEKPIITINTISTAGLSPEKAILLANKIIEEETIETVRKRLSFAERNLELATRAHNETKSERRALEQKLIQKEQENHELAKAVKQLQTTIDQLRAAHMVI